MLQWFVDENYVEHDLACLTNSGYIYVFNVPQLRNQLKGNGIGLETRLTR